MQVHPYRVRLNNGGLAVDIHYQSGQPVTLAVNETIRVVVLANQTYTPAHDIRSGYTLLPEVLGQTVHTERQQTYGYRAYLPVTDTQHLTVGAHHANQLALVRHRRTMIGIQRNTRYSTAEHPRMKAENRLLLMRLESDYGHKICIL